MADSVESIGHGAFEDCSSLTSVEIPSDTIRGDLNGDTIVDVSDVNILINIILGYETNNELIVAADLTGDNLPDVSDVNALINIILHKE